MIQHVQECQRNFRVEQTAGACEKGLRDFTFVFLRKIRSGVDGIVIIIGDGKNAGTQRNVVIFQMLGISAAVPALMMEADVRDQVLACRVGFQHIGTQVGMLFIGLELPCTEIGVMGERLAIVSRPMS